MSRDVEQYSRIREQFLQQLKGRGMRSTPERLEVLELIYNSEAMLSVKELLQKLEQKRFRISRATLYNVLDLLCEWNYAVKMQLDKGYVVYGKADNCAPQLVFQCVECGKFFNVELPIWHELVDECRSEYGFVLENQKVLGRGLCKKCKKD